jgi:spermidine/putrescine-binding protein
MNEFVGFISGLLKSGIVFGGVLFLCLFSTGYYRSPGQARTVNVFMWSGYLAPDTLSSFTDRTHIQVNVDYYDTNEALLAKLSAGNVEYDVVGPSDYMVEILVRQKLLAPIDHSKVPNFRNVEPRLTRMDFDPENRYSLPFTWGTTGIGYRKDKIKKAVDSWSCLWDPEYRGHVVMLDDMREATGAALKYLGYSLNTKNKVQLRRARELLIRQKPLLKEYNACNAQDLLLSGDAWIVQGYSGQIGKAAREYPILGYAIPKEGCTMSVDTVAIAAKARHLAEAHELLNYMLDPAVAARACQFTNYSTANRAARELLPAAVLENPIVFPPEASLIPCEGIRDPGPVLQLYDRHWTEVKAM